MTKDFEIEFWKLKFLRVVFLEIFSFEVLWSILNRLSIALEFFIRYQKFSASQNT